VVGPVGWLKAFGPVVGPVGWLKAFGPVVGPVGWLAFTHLRDLYFNEPTCMYQHAADRMCCCWPRASV